MVAPDSGGTERARIFASRLKLDLALMDYREENGAYPKIVGNVKGRKVIILDDMIDTGRTVLRTTSAAMQPRAREASRSAPFIPCSPGRRVDKDRASPIAKMLVTDTIPLSNAQGLRENP